MHRSARLATLLAIVALPAAGFAQPFFEETFDATLGVFIAGNDGQASNVWMFDNTCPATGLAGHSASGTAHWINPTTCLDYGTGGSTDVIQSPRVEIPDCTTPGGVRVGFNYFLDYQEGASCDRARVEATVDGGDPVVYADNGLPGLCDFGRPEGNGAENVGLDNLLNDATWRHHEFIVPDALPGTFLQLTFVGETSDGILNSGEGFLVDDVTMECLVPFYEVPTMSTVGFGAFGALLAAAALVAMARRRRQSR
jgi:hypothetical protein